LEQFENVRLSALKYTLYSESIFKIATYSDFLAGLFFTDLHSLFWCKYHVGRTWFVGTIIFCTYLGYRI